MLDENVTINFLITDDIPACVRIMTENDLWKRYGVSQETAERMFSRALEEDATILVARLNGQAAGFAWVVMRGAWDRSPYLRLIGILPEYQRQGIGERLMREVESRVARESIDIFLLVTDTNIAAQKFYRKLGYQQVGVIPDYVVRGIDEMIFYKGLSSVQTKMPS